MSDQIKACRSRGVAPKVDTYHGDVMVICDEGCYDPDPDDLCSDRVAMAQTRMKNRATPGRSGVVIGERVNFFAAGSLIS